VARAAAARKKFGAPPIFMGAVAAVFLTARRGASELNVLLLLDMRHG